MKLSIVTGTLNRLPHLQRFIASIAPSCGGIEYEIIIVDGGSTDGTLAWLRSQPVVLIEQGAPLGAVAAFNAGFWAAEGDYVANMNDDCVVVGPTLRLACDYLDAHHDVGQVCFPWHDVGDTTIQVIHFHVGFQKMDVIYANFGATRRSVGDAVGWWGTWEHYSGDAELSLQVMLAGYRVVELPGGEVLHYRVQDHTRRVCYHNPAFNDKWMRNFDATKLLPAR